MDSGLLVCIKIRSKVLYFFYLLLTSNLGYINKRKPLPIFSRAYRKRIEISIYQIESLFLRKLHAATFVNFFIKAVLFIFIS
ncbi:hypothetical protein Aasi_1834 [Candidatus Amoebophilus asiaticus 5a2]|uniref:Uncharacterized protein n=1 Tax=Amoebophilus asiaticus (strain 5a2) TaxID=452471 RepID=C3L438_AMOA5|nr:hypothetical protein Aasi_1834 [Candidatus Amoebophilus asiaticus 5a2]